MATFPVSSASCNTSVPLEVFLENDRKRLLRDTFSRYAESGQGNAMEHLFLYRRRYHEDGEIGIFDADKYFSGGGSCREKAVPVAEENGGKQPQVDQVKEEEEEERSDLLLQKQKIKASSIRSATPSTTCYSEPSWNSQSTLLLLLQKQKDPSPSPHKKLPKPPLPTSKRLLIIGGFCCSSSCAGEKSVDVDDKSTNPINCRRSATTNHCSSTSSTTTTITTTEEEKKKPEEFELRKDEEKARAAASFLEVHGSDFLEKDIIDQEEKKKKNIIINNNMGPSPSPNLLRRGLTMLTIDVDQDDLLSESSSDLFEIGLNPF